MLFRDRRDDRVGLGDGVGAARVRIDQRQLAEDLIFSERLEQAVSRTDFDLAAPDDEELFAPFALPENDFASREKARRNVGAKEKA